VWMADREVDGLFIGSVSLGGWMLNVVECVAWWLIG